MLATLPSYIERGTIPEQSFQAVQADGRASDGLEPYDPALTPADVNQLIEEVLAATEDIALPNSNIYVSYTFSVVAPRTVQRAIGRRWHTDPVGQVFIVNGQKLTTEILSGTLDLSQVAQGLRYQRDIKLEQADKMISEAPEKLLLEAGASMASVMPYSITEIGEAYHRSPVNLTRLALPRGFLAVALLPKDYTDDELLEAS